MLTIGQKSKLYNKYIKCIGFSIDPQMDICRDNFEFLELIVICTPLYIFSILFSIIIYPSNLEMVQEFWPGQYCLCEIGRDKYHPLET